MKHPLKVIAIGLLPLLTLVLGWQLGTRYEVKKLVDQKESLEFFYTGGVGSGQTVTNPKRRSRSYSSMVCVEHFA